MNLTKTFTLHERILSIGLLALDGLQEAATPEGFGGVLFVMLKKATEKNPRFLSDMLEKKLTSIGDDQLRLYIRRLRDEIIPYLLDEDANPANKNPG